MVLEALRCRTLSLGYETDCCLKATGKGHVDLLRAAVGLSWESPHPEPPSAANGTSLFQGEGRQSDLALSLVCLPLARVMGRAVSVLGATGKSVARCWLNPRGWYFRLFSWRTRCLGKRGGSGTPDVYFYGLPAVQQKSMSCLHPASACLCNELAKHRSKCSCNICLLFNCKEMGQLPLPRNSVNAVAERTAW